MPQRILPLLILWMMLLVPPGVRAAVEADSACLTAARQAAAGSVVPEALLRAITLVETGRQPGRAPWPWTVHSGGGGHWFPSKAEAVEFARQEIAAGRDRLDIGCFQMNLYWHGDRFASLEVMMDPLTNAQAAARFLEELHAETGSWTEAAAAYHSRDPTLARSYLERIAALTGRADAPVADHAVSDGGKAAPSLTPRFNRYPLLAAGGRGQGASLVPVVMGRGRLIGAE